MNQRTSSFQGLRVLMIMGVVLLHTYMCPIFGAGEELVSFFFVVSGFLYKDKLPWRQFVEHKFKQIFPFYWLVLLIVVFVQLLRHQNIFSIGFLGHLFLLQSWVPSMSLTYAFSYVGAAWFLSSLIFCYVMASPLYKMVSKLTLSYALAIFSFAYLSICLCRYYEYNFTYGVWLAYASPLFRLLEYTMGMITFHIIKNTIYKKCSIKMEVYSFLFLACYIIVIYKQVFGGASSLFHVAMLAYIYSVNSRLIHAILGNRFLISFAKYSMAIYLTHQSLTLSILRPHVSFNLVLLGLCVLSGILFCKFYTILKIFSRVFYVKIYRGGS